MLLLLLLLRGRTGRGCDDRRELLRGRPHQRVDETGKYGEQPAEIREKLQRKFIIEQKTMNSEANDSHGPK